MYEIKDIYKVNFMNKRFAYSGTLRNEKKFNIDDNVFANIFDNEILRCVVIGVEKTLDDNPDYIYKLRLPDNSMFENNPTLKCNKIFNTIDEAKQSAIKNAKCMYELQQKEIERYFSQFEKVI